MFSIEEIPLYNTERKFVNALKPEEFSKILYTMLNHYENRFRLFKYKGMFSVYWSPGTVSFSYKDTVRDIKYLPTRPYNIYHKIIRVNIDELINLYIGGI